jgi:Phytanoyl-CoA dioxygenase (PhyH)
MNWQDKLKTDGYAYFGGLTPKPLIVAAKEAIERDLSTNYDPRRQAKYDGTTYCPGITAATQIMDLFVASPIYNIIDEVLGIDKVKWSRGQIAIRKAHNWHQRIDPEPHIDGFAEGLNDVPPDKIYNHTALVGVFLTPVRAEFSGNFTVWPGSHYAYEHYFRERGPRAMREPRPRLALGQPTQLMCEPGDVVLAHYQMGHTAAVNTSDWDRIAVYFRIVLRTVEMDSWHYLINMWEGWRLAAIA